MLTLLTAGLSSSLAAPAWACGCGAYIPDRPGSAVSTERALVAWDGTTEHIVMSFDVSGSSQEAAWVMPVPSAAETSLDDPALFEALDERTAPRVEYRDDWWPTFEWLVPTSSSGALDTVGAPGAGVNVLGRQRLGPFDVTRLEAGDSVALTAWLAGHGFPTPDGIDANLAPYVERGWELVAIKLVAAAGSSDLSGTLQPLRLSFASDEVVYPMRLSRSATLPQTIDLFVLVAHRMDPTALPVEGVPPTLEFAGRLEAPSGAAVLDPYLADGTYLTRWSNYIADPAAIDGDYVFGRASSDEPFQRVTYVTRERGELTGLLLLAAAGSGVVAAVIVLLRRRNHAQPAPTPATDPT